MVEKIYKEIREIKKYALDNNIPIIVDEGLDFLINFVIKRKIINILEIGTGIGYSSIMMALCSPNVKVTTIEKDRQRYLDAIKNVKKMDLEEQITLVYKDALTFKATEKYDLIFIDAERGKGEDLFNRFAPNLAPKGIIITNNVTLNGYANKELKEIKNLGLRMLVKKVKKYIDFLNNNKSYKTIFYEIGDSIAVTEKI